jgi:hypothetical protein
MEATIGFLARVLTIATEPLMMRQAHRLLLIALPFMMHWSSAAPADDRDFTPQFLWLVKMIFHRYAVSIAGIDREFDGRKDLDFSGQSFEVQRTGTTG